MKRNLFLLPAFLFAVVLAASCSKSGGTTDVPVVPVRPDTLSAGWTSTNLDTVLYGGVSFSDIYFNNNTTGYAVGNALWKSTNGGVSWQRTVISPQGQNMSVTANGTLFIVPYYTGNGLSKSTDGAVSFSTIYTLNPGLYNDIFFSGNDTGYISTNLGFLRSVNAGNNWAPVSTTGLPNGAQYGSLFFFNDNLGWICDSSNVYKTNGNINNWTKSIIHTSAPFNWVYSIYPTSASNIYLSVSSGEIYKSTDGGANFYLKSTRFANSINSGSDIHFVNDNTGYIAFGKRIYKTTDGGSTWQVVVALGEKGIVEIHFTDASHGWACADGLLLRYNL